MPGDVLVFEEVLGPGTGISHDANPAQRHAVRLTTVALTQDPLGGRFAATPTDDPVNITEIAWAAADALPFPVCISARTDVEHGQQFIADVSIARGNMVLVDHGLTLANELLGSVPEPTLFRTLRADGDHCQPGERVPIPARFRPHLSGRPLTHAAPYDAQCRGAYGSAPDRSGGTSRHCTGAVSTIPIQPSGCRNGIC